MMNWIKRTALVTALAGLMAVGMSAPVAAEAASQPRAGEQPRERGQDERRGRPDRPERPEPAQIGQKAPDFALKDLEGNEWKLSDHKGKVVVLEWFNPDCPFVVKHHKVHKTMEETYKKYKDEGVVWVAINSAAPGLQGAGQDRNERAYRDFEMVFPLLLDETNKVAHLYGARVTPQMYIIDREGVLRYNGAIDNDRHRTRLGDINYVDQALGQVLRNETVNPAETRAYGCTVKYAN